MKSLQKCRDRRGESIAEALIALLISCIGLMMLAGLISSSGRMISQSSKTLETYYAAGNQLEEKAEGGGVPFTMVLKDSARILPDETFSVRGYVNDTLGRHPVVSYRPEEEPSP